MQEILSIIIDHHTPDEQVQRIITTLWYLWKARNDKRFNNKSWTVFQVHSAVSADMATTLLILDKIQDEAQTGTQQGDNPHSQGMNFTIAGAGAQGRPLLTETTTGRNLLMNEECREHNRNNSELQPKAPLYRLCYPIFLSGTRCYTDAATSPDQEPQTPRKAGLGIFIINSEQGQEMAALHTGQNAEHSRCLCPRQLHLL